jgi:hypothetical protein
MAGEKKKIESEPEPEPELYYIRYRHPSAKRTHIMSTTLTPEQAERLVESLEAMGWKCWLMDAKDVKNAKPKSKAKAAEV